MGRYIKLDENNIIVGTRNGYSIVIGEIESDTGELFQIMQEGGAFITPEPEPPIETQLDRMENTLDLLLLKQEGIL